MIKHILFDVDGVVILGDGTFSERYAQEFGVPHADLMKFFKERFADCATGKADTKVEIQKYFKLWKWDKSAEELFKYWFEGESDLNEPLMDMLPALKKKNITVSLSTSNEKYRAEYIWKTLKLNKSFDHLFSSCYIGHIKSDQEFWQTAWEQLGKPEKSSVLVWDDGEKNLEAAKTFGFRTEFYQNFDDFEKKMRELP